MKMMPTYTQHDAPESNPLRRKVLPALIAGCFTCSPALANPTGAQVVSGQVSMTSSGNTLTITNSPGSIISWQNFSINPGELTQFLQQSSSSTVLNRIIGQNPSQIFGALQSNGKVFLINPNGVVFGANSQVNLAGLVASSLDITNGDFTAGKFNFNAGTTAGAVTNQGSIVTPVGGQVYLLAPQVKNNGIISSPQGEVLLAAGHNVQLVDGGNPDIQVVISAPADQAINLGNVVAESGKVGIYGALVNQQGTVNANTAVVGQNGQIYFKASGTTTLSGDSQTTASGNVQGATGGTVAVLGAQVNLTDNAQIDASGQAGGGSVVVGGYPHNGNSAILSAMSTSLGAHTTINANAITSGNGGNVTVSSTGTTAIAGTINAEGGAVSGNGGAIDTSGAKLTVANGAVISTAAAKGTTGTWLIDPTDFTIAASGGDMTGLQLDANLLLNNVTIQSSSGATGTSGNINVDDTVAWAIHSLTLNAQNNININTSLLGTGSASLVLQYGQGAPAAGNTSVYALNNGSRIDLPAGQNFSTKQGSDGATVNYTVITSLGAQGSTTGTDLQGINGNVSGNYALGLDINAAVTSSWGSGTGFAPLGTTAQPFTGNFDGLGHAIVDLNINPASSNNGVGLFGVTSATANIRNIGLYNAAVRGTMDVGALVGYNDGTISNSYVVGTVLGTGDVGGLVGYNGGLITNSTVLNSVISGDSQIGGLVGDNSGTITTGVVLGGSVSGVSYVGGLAGENTAGSSIGSASYATASVVGTSSGNNVGGLVGANYGTIDRSFASGSVTGSVNVGGLTGVNGSVSAITNSYATGNVGGTGNYVGGLVGLNSGSVERSFASGNVTQSGLSSIGVGGLVGQNNAGSIGNSFATGAVSVSGTDAGGLVGLNYGLITNSYATGNVQISGVTVTGSNMGGLVGQAGSTNNAKSTITNSYALGSVSGRQNVGGLVGYNYGTISTSYAALGSVSGASAGGFVGRNASVGTISGSYWDIDLNTVGVSAGTPTGAVGLTLSQLHEASSMPAFAFTTTAGASGNSWVIVDSDSTFNNAGSTTGTLPMLTSEWSTSINSAHGLQLIGLSPSASYTLVNNINAGSTSSTHDVWFGSGGITGFIPIGSATTQFTGTLNGQSAGTLHTISGLFIDSADTNVGLFAVIGSTGVVENLGLSNATVEGTTVLNNNVGGLAGINHGTISSAYATGSVSGALLGTSAIGGLVGYNYGTVSGSFSSARVASNVATTLDVGGLVGNNNATGTIVNSYASGSVISLADAGGLVGMNQGSIANSYASGSVTAVTGGGLVGPLSSNTTATNSYWDISSTGQSSSVSGVGLQAADMLSSSNFVSWDFSNTWTIYQGYTAPLLQAFMTPLTVKAIGATETFSGNAFSGGNGLIYSNVVNASLLTAEGSGFGGNSQGAVSAGTYLITPTYSSSQLGYLIEPVSGRLVINPLALTGTISTGSSTYGSSLSPGSVSFGNAVSGYIPTATVTVATGSQTSSSGNLNAGSYTGVESISSLSGAAAGDYTYQNISGSYTVGKLALTGTVATGSSTYGSSTTPGALTLTNLVSGDNVSASTVTLTTAGLTSGSGNLVAGSHAGIETVNGSLSGTDAGNYTFGGASGAYIVSPLALTGTVSTGSSTYGSTLIPGTASFTGVISGDTVSAGSVTVNITGLTSSSGKLTAGTHTGIETVTTLTGADAGNYTYSGVTGNYDVSKLALTGTITTGSSTYGSSLSPGSVVLNTAVSGDSLGTPVVTVNTTGLTSVSGNLVAGSHTGVESISSYSGSDAGNYLYTGITGGYVVSKLAVSVTGQTANNKVYDGTTTGTVSGGTIVGAVSGDLPSLHLGQSGTFASANVGNGIALTITETLSGDAASNYVLTAPTTSLTANITPATLTIAGQTAANKVYDGTTTANLSGGTLVGVVGSDAVTLNQSGSFASKNAGNGIPLILSDTLSGAAAGNYVLVQPTGVTANITPATLTVSGETVANKVYDGTTTATLSGGTLNGVITGDVVTLVDAGNFASKNVGTGIAITTSNTLSGTAASNYVISQPTALAANITPAVLTVGGASANNKVYDGTTTETFAGTLTGVVIGDTVTLVPTGTFATKNAGNGIAVTATGSLSGADAGNYTLVEPAGLTANITPLAISVSAAGTNKVYDGTVNDLVTLTSGAVIAGDTVSFSDSSATFANKNVGNGKTVQVAGITMTGADAANYTLTNNSASTVANITPAILAVFGETANNKVYDGTTSATLTGGTLNGVIAGDAVALTQAGAFTSSGAGANVPVIASDSISGADAANYSLVQPAGLAANITLPVTVATQITAQNSPITQDVSAAIVGATPTLNGVPTGGSQSSTFEIFPKNSNSSSSSSSSTNTSTGATNGSAKKFSCN